ncbi:hypothetical protein BMJ20_14405 [Sinorhizobium medicae]|nr:hypothetical protein BMJ31_11495 [Sinorhizobium medicae]PLU28720.1 hypothetical protein BMJ28_27225 [Sinorhizobium medicae]PLU69987.1 hypothetical protein BMJ20_14405 [Sinorhizobium medicae]
MNAESSRRVPHPRLALQSRQRPAKVVNGRADLVWPERLLCRCPGRLSWFSSDLPSAILGNLASGNDGFGYGLILEAASASPLATTGHSRPRRS